MKFAFLTFSLLAILLFSNAPASAQAKTLNVCYDQWPPMTIFPTKADQRRGFVIDIVSDIYKNAGYDLVFFEVPYGRGMDMVASGHCDLLPETAYSDSPHPDYVFANKETFIYPMAFVLRKGQNWSYDGVASIGNMRVATGPGWDYSSMSKAYQAYLDAPENQDKVEVVAGDNDVVNRIFSMIVNNRIDLYADNFLVLQYIMNETGLANKLDIVLAGPDYRLIERPIFSRKLDEAKRKELITIWNNGRSHLDKQSEKQYLARYGVDLFMLD